MTSKTVSDDDLREAATDVVYEFKLFRHAKARYVSAPVISSPQHPSSLSPMFPSRGNNDAMLGIPLTLQVGTASMSSLAENHLERDALLIHFRVLMDFFYGDGKFEGDVLAHHFTGGARREAPRWHSEFKTKCDRLFAHLTYYRARCRIRDDHHWYEIPAYAGDLEGEIAAFLGSLLPERREWFGVIDN